MFLEAWHKAFMSLVNKAIAHLQELETKLRNEYKTVQNMNNKNELGPIQERLKMYGRKIKGTEYKQFFIHAECGKLRLTRTKGSSLSHGTVEEK